MNMEKGVGTFIFREKGYGTMHKGRKELLAFLLGSRVGMP